MCIRKERKLNKMGMRVLVSKMLKENRQPKLMTIELASNRASTTLSIQSAITGCQHYIEHQLFNTNSCRKNNFMRFCVASKRVLY